MRTCALAPACPPVHQRVPVHARAWVPVHHSPLCLAVACPTSACQALCMNAYRSVSVGPAVLLCPSVCVCIGVSIWSASAHACLRSPCASVCAEVSFLLSRSLSIYRSIN
eukprot:4745985-Pleurochrysis_carterae.AAC.2